MSDEKPKPFDDLKQGFGLLFRAAKSVAEVAAEKIPGGKLEEVALDAVREVGRAFETVGGEIDKAWNKATGSGPPPAHADTHVTPPADAAPETAPSPGSIDPQGAAPANVAPPSSADDETPRGPRVG